MADFKAERKRYKEEINKHKAEIRSLNKYKRQILSIKQKQRKPKQKRNKNEKVKYVFAEDIKQIKVFCSSDSSLRVSICFEDDEEEETFNDIEVVLPQKMKEQQKIIDHLTDELECRVKDIQRIRSLDLKEYVNKDVLNRHNNVSDCLELRKNNKLWRSALIKQAERGNVFETWMKAQRQLKQGHQPSISLSNGIVLKHLQTKCNLVVDDNNKERDESFLRVSTAKHIQKQLNESIMTDLNGFFISGQGEYNEDNVDEDSKYHGDSDNDEDEKSKQSDVDDDVTIATSDSWDDNEPEEVVEKDATDLQIISKQDDHSSSELDLDLFVASDQDPASNIIMEVKDILSEVDEQDDQGSEEINTSNAVN